MHNFKKNQQLEVKIEKNVYQGYGLANVDGFRVFVEKSVVEDELKVILKNVNKNFAYGEISEIISSSQHRIKPKCPYAKVCGSCQWGFIRYETQLQLKKQIVQEALKKFGNIDFEVEPTFPHCFLSGDDFLSGCRQKIQMPFGKSKNSKKIKAGYYEAKTHKLININFCYQAGNAVNETLKQIKTIADTFNIEVYNEKTHKGLLRHVLFRHSLFLNKLMVTFVINEEKIPKKFQNFLKQIQTIDYVSSVCVNFNTLKTNVITGKRTCCIYEQEPFVEKLGDTFFKIDSNSFFQVNVRMFEQILKSVKDYIDSRFDDSTYLSLLDAYCGVGSFGLFLANNKKVKELFAVEKEQSSVENFKENLKLNKIENAYIFSGNVFDIFENFQKENKLFDVSIIDPPRAGSDEKSLENLVKLTKKTIIYLSCNPVTLARDLKYLVQNGFHPIKVKPYDMFANTYHIETLVILER